MISAILHQFCFFRKGDFVRVILLEVVVAAAVASAGCYLFYSAIFAVAAITFAGGSTIGMW